MNRIDKEVLRPAICSIKKAPNVFQGLRYRLFHLFIQEQQLLINFYPMATTLVKQNPGSSKRIPCVGNPERQPSYRVRWSRCLRCPWYIVSERKPRSDTNPPSHFPWSAYHLDISHIWRHLKWHITDVAKIGHNINDLHKFWQTAECKKDWRKYHFRFRQKLAAFIGQSCSCLTVP